jgi:hypothetical protein
MNQEQLEQDRTESRVDPRVALAVQAEVELEGLAPRGYGVCEISRGGMFLAYKDPEATLQEYEHHGIDGGTACDIAFSVQLPGHRQHLRLSATIVRITEHGIGVQFKPHDPPPLAALNQLFARVEKHL